ncbi:hypothetical protein DY000_02003293 [Brassica cretica]|uniref:Uncharacterized protein n=1 Tax=Brassica cretica TaxID=69181 RepID=A0ABQ7CEY7_BRACR|nr:hypothetical protein DY000_02003293 [Brassica cretica]
MVNVRLAEAESVQVLHPEHADSLWMIGEPFISGSRTFGISLDLSTRTTIDDDAVKLLYMVNI